MKNTEICLYVTVNSVTLTKKRHGEDTVSHRICHSELQHIFIYIIIFVEKTRHNKHYVVLLR